MGKHENPKDKKIKLEEWKGKGVDWLAITLWNTRRELEKAKSNIGFYRQKSFREQARNDVDYYVVEKANEAMADALISNGIRPTKLRITYEGRDCDNCDVKEEEGAWECFECEPNQTYTTTLAFYTYLISGRTLEGITAQFEQVEYDLIKVVDERTGEIIGEWRRTETSDD